MLIALGVGCYLRQTFLSILLYADDVALLAPSLKGLQTLLHVTEEYCKQWDILLNAKKTKNLHFGKKCELPNLTLDGKAIVLWSLLCARTGLGVVPPRQVSSCPLQRG